MDTDNAQSIPDKKSCVIDSDIKRKILEYKHENPSLFAWEVRDCLSEEMNCKLEDLPSVSSIHTLLKNLDSKSGDKHQNQTSFTQKQNDGLEQVFNIKHYPELSEREKLALEFNISEPRIQIWFQNRRMEYRESEKVKFHQQDQPKQPTDLLSANKFCSLL
ncbi:unnamed protein product [Adineta steineri]|uniref:Uncharacterized protein n=1 Tax=Adineta steineri TaxID=433720 RepID=A0A816DDJ8_9BILA|nr:unnamed protein product [Adineta steineri]CAF1635887.1 unnamed protein product [Adineta steineri]